MKEIDAAVVFLVEAVLDVVAVVVTDVGIAVIE